MGGGKIIIGDGTFINYGAVIISLAEVRIGNNCAIGTNVSIYDHDHVYKREGNNNWNESKATPVTIGNNCWIGCNVVILRGATIGDNCVIAAGTVVKGKVSSHSLVYNNKELLIREIK